MKKSDLINLINKCADDAEFVIWGDDGRLCDEFRLSVVYTKNGDFRGKILISNKININNDKKRTFGNDQRSSG